MFRAPKLTAVSLLSLTALAACVSPDDCQEPEAPFVLREGVYEKYDDPVILAREACLDPGAPVKKLFASGGSGGLTPFGKAGVVPDDRGPGGEIIEEPEEDLSTPDDKSEHDNSDHDDSDHDDSTSDDSTKDESHSDDSKSDDTDSDDSTSDH